MRKGFRASLRGWGCFRQTSRAVGAMLAVCAVVSLCMTVPGDSFANTPKERSAKTSTAKSVSKSSAKSNRKTAKKEALKSRKMAVNRERGRTHSSTQKRQITRSYRGGNDDARFAALVVDAKTGQILYEKNAEEIRHPASLTKMMTLYLTFDALKRGDIAMDSQLEVSDLAASQPQTNISLQEGDRIHVKDAIESLVVRSANDSSMVLAEALGHSQSGFAKMMNEKARELGMRSTQFYNPNGLPDSRQVTTAMDLAKLAIALKRDFPEYYRFFSERSFAYHGKVYPTHNRVLLQYAGADGLKTGYIRASGFNLVTSVSRGSYRLVGVVMGGATAAARDQQMMNLLDRTFTQLALREGSKTQQAKNAPVSAQRRAEQDSAPKKANQRG